MQKVNIQCSPEILLSKLWFSNTYSRRPLHVNKTIDQISLKNRLLRKVVKVISEFDVTPALIERSKTGVN